jgi:Fe-S cluster assembly protein SufD
MKIRSTTLGAGWTALVAAQRAAAPEPAWLSARRSWAVDRLRQDGLPTRNVEEWKYTNISPLADRTLVLPPVAPAPGALPAGLPFWHEEDLNFVFVDGRYAPEWSSIGGSTEVEWTRLADLGADPEPDSPATLTSVLMNAAFRGDGVRVRIPARRRVARRIHFVLLHAGAAPDVLIAPWLAVAAEEGAEARVAVTALSLSEAPCVHVPRVLVAAGAGAQLSISQTQVLNTASWQLGTTRIEQQRDSRVIHLDAALGGALARHDLAAVLLESNAEVELNGLYALRDRRHTDFHTLIEHRQPNCRSRQVYKGILDGKAAAVFNGAVRVHPGASGTDGYQLNRALLMSRDAQMYSKPELLIDNDDVKCSHGASIGQLSEQELFYLQSRGIPEPQARRMLARAFVEDILFRQADERQRGDLDALLDRYFAEAHA